MTVTQNLMASGDWTLQLDPNTPQRILDQIGFFGHIVITEAPEDIRLAGDNVLSTALYTGVIRGTSADLNGTLLSGAGMAIWLGDEDDKGAVLETARTYTGASFTSVIADLLTGAAIHAGTVHAVTGTYTGTHQYQSPRKAISYVCTTMGAEWRVNNNGTLDAGLISDLYPTTPRAGVFAKSRGSSMALKALDGAAQLASDVQDFTTRVVLLAEGTETTVATGSADILTGLNPYKDIFGNTVKMTRLVSESSTDTGNATVRAQLALNQFTGTRNAVTLNSTTHDVAGSLAVGEYVWVYDPDAGLYDLANEIQWQGERLNAALLRVTSLTWPVEDGRGVYVRTTAGTWLDITNYVTYETGQTNVTVGGYDRSLVGGGVESVPLRIAALAAPNTTIPNAPTFTVPFTQATYLSTLSGQTKVQIRLAWTQPTNTDGTAITDGDHYEIRFRSTTQPIAPVTHAQMTAFTHSTLGAQPNQEPVPYTTGTWDTRMTGFDNLTYTMIELTPGITYEFQIRAVDDATLANASVWSGSQFVTSIADNLPPSTPAPATVAGSRVAIEVRHDLGKAEGGTFNLEQDLNHLEVHVQYEPNYEPKPTAPSAGGTLVGKLRATAAEINGAIPVVGTFQTDMTQTVYVKVVAVDNAGNRSRPSTAATVTALLIDSAHISDLVADKVTAGSLSAAYILGGQIATGTTPGTRRALMTGANGFQTYDETDALTFWAGSNGSVFAKGEFRTGWAGERHIHLGAAGSTGRLDFFAPDGNNGYLQSLTESTGLEAIQFGMVVPTSGYSLWNKINYNSQEWANYRAWKQELHYLDNNGTSTGFFGVWHDNDRAASASFAQLYADPNIVLGAYLTASQARLYVDSGALTVYASGTSQFQVSDTNDAIYCWPSGTANGRIIIISDAGNGGNSARMQFFTAAGFGNLLKVFNNGTSVNIENRDWSDASFQAFTASAYTTGSSNTTKTDITDVTFDARSKIKGTKVKQYRRLGGTQAPNTDHHIPDLPVQTSTGPNAGDIKIDHIPPAKKAAAPPPTAPITPQPGPLEIGLIAEEVPPELFRQTSDGGGVDLYAMVSLLWKGMQEQMDENDALTARVAALEAAVALLTKKGPPA